MEKKKKKGRPTKIIKKIVAPMVKTKKKECGNCDYGFQSAFDKKVECKRFPPVPISGGNHIFPTIPKTEICGEYKERTGG